MNDNELVVCVIDDDISVRESIAALARTAGLCVEAFASAQEYLAAPRSLRTGCLVLDVEMPGLSGLELQQRLESSRADVPIVFVSGHGDVPKSVRALKAGALDFLTKPFDPDLLLSTIRAALTSQKGVASKQQSSVASPDIVGQSAVLGEVLAQARTVASTDSTALIYGETGTGKELIARTIHECSERRRGPFVKLNCAAIPAGLLESELMGHERGAFTGAVAQRIGRFELANDGTLFLDELGELPLELQPKLLRLLQEREFERVGGTRTLRSNARLIAATHRDLKVMVHERTFREDLFYRLSVFPITLPPLRERRQDIPVLAEHFVRQLAVRLNKDVRAISATAMARLTQYNWPGNIRELQNVVERAMILGQGPTLEVPPLHNEASPDVSALQGDDLAAFNKAHILGVLEATGWIVAGPHGAAARLGVKRSTLNYRMKKLGILQARARARLLSP